MKLVGPGFGGGTFVFVFYHKGLLISKLLNFPFCLLVYFVYNLYTLLHFSLSASIFFLVYQ